MPPSAFWDTLVSQTLTAVVTIRVYAVTYIEIIFGVEYDL